MIHITNGTLLGIALFLIKLVGLGSLLAVQIPIVGLTSAIGVWVFYVQHTFELMYWKRENEWNYLEACQRSSSYYDLPRILQWFTLNNGIHHIHHLDSRIPNYRLEECYKAHPEFQEVTKITLANSLTGLFLALWDEDKQQMVRFSDLKLSSQKNRLT